MADNKQFPLTGSGDATARAATKEVTFSGETTDVQLIELVAVGGTEGSRTITEISDETNGLLVDLGANNDVTISSVTPDLMLGTDFSNVLGTSSLILATQADDVVNTSDGLQTSSFGYYFDGTAWDRMRGDATDGLLVNLGSNNDVTVSGNLTTVSTVTNLAQLGGTAVSMNTGAVDAGTQRVTVATDDTVTVDNGGTFVVQEDGAALTSLQKLDNIAHSGSDVALVEHVPISGQLDDTATTTVTENQIAPIRITSSRAMHVSVQDSLPAGTNNIGDVDIASALPAGDNNIGNVDIASAIPAGTNNIGDVDVLTLPSIPAGTNNIGDVDIASALPAGTNDIGDIGQVARTSGGATIATKTISAASTNATSTKASAGQLFGIQCYNINASARYLKLYNKASAPTVGTDTPVKTLMIPGNTAGAGFVISFPLGIEFTTGIAFALTTGIADSDTGAVAANEIVVNLDYA